MRKFLWLITFALLSMTANAENVEVNDTIELPEVRVTSLYRNNVNVGYVIDAANLVSSNYGQEPSHLFSDQCIVRRKTFQEHGCSHASFGRRVSGRDASV